MLGPGAAAPSAQVWRTAGKPPVRIAEILRGHLSLLCFYPFDWSPTCTSELLLLHERRADLKVAGIRPIGISRDSPWSHRAFAEALGVDLLLLSDANGEAACGFGVASESLGIHDVAERAAFLIDHSATVRASWPLGTDLPDVDAVIAAAFGLSELESE
jgi:peroxiredoxin